MNAAELLGVARAEEGRRFGAFRLLDEIGRGAMGVVFSACDAAGRVVALKMPHAGADAAVVQRFRAEASAAAALDHPGILPIHEVGECDGVPFFTMRFAECGSLAERVKDFSGNPRAAAELVAKIADALAHAHERGLLHRDVKPSNILLAAPAEPLLGDFGLARWLGRDSALTVAGAVLGTPSYLAPELLGPKAEATTASDIFSLGAVLYHLLCGRPPFVGDSVAATLALVAEGAPPAPRSLNAALPRDLDAVVLRSLARDPAQRYASAREFAADLRRWLDGELVDARPASPAEIAWRWCRRRPAVAALLAALLVVAALLVWRIETGRRDESAAKARAEIAAAQLRETNAQLGDSLDRIELDRAEDLFRAGDSGGALAPLVRIVRRNPAHPIAAARLASALWHGAFALPLTPPFAAGGEVMLMQFLRDGKTLLIGSKRGASTWDAAAGRRLLEFERDAEHASGSVLSPDERTLAEWSAAPGKFLRLIDAATGRLCAPPIPHADWLHTVEFSPDSARIVTTSNNPRVHLRDARTGEVSGEPLNHEPTLWSAKFSPDGETIATVSHTTVRLWDSRTRQMRAESPMLDEHGAKVIRFSPDGRWLIAASSSGTVRLLSTTDAQFPGTPMQHGGRIRSAEFSADSRWLLTASDDHSARVWAVPGGEALTPPLRHRDMVSFAAFSPDNSRIVTCSVDHTARVWDALTGRPLSQPLRHLEQPHAAAFTPDGATLYTSGADGIVQRWDVRNFPEPPAAPAPPPETAGKRVSADGRKMLTFGEHANTAVLSDAKTGAVIGATLAHLDEITDATFSPDGSLVATASNANEARVWDAATGRAVSPPLRHPRTVAAVAFSPDGTRVVTSSWDGTARVWDARTGAPLARALTHDDHVREAHFSPDGRRVATASRDKTARVWDATTGQPLTEPLRHDAPIQRVRFESGGQRIATSTAFAMRTWDVPDFPTPPPAWLAQLAEILSLAELPPDPLGALALIARYEETRAAALAETGDGAYARLARRLFAPAGRLLDTPARKK